jgi:peptidoglycan hydrolase-like protein with peptidoglycan-binding domain
MSSKVLITGREYLHKNLGHIVTFLTSTAIVAMLAVGFTQFASAQTYASLTAQMNPGATGANVTNLQAFLASTSFYPEGLVTGYYGPLTQAAVQRLQAYYGIVSSGSPSTTGYGRVGPSTLAKINALIATGGVSVGGDTSAPYISGTLVAATSNGAVISWNTNELATGRVYYSTSPITFNEGDINSTGFVVTSGQSASFDTTTRLNHSASIGGLAPNTTYYYLIVVTDPSGNVSISLPGATFRTGM